jgi:hypothetical protein
MGKIKTRVPEKSGDPVYKPGSLPGRVREEWRKPFLG